jgi:predicted LPLAT superfamily acyltransferase
MKLRDKKNGETVHADRAADSVRGPARELGSPTGMKLMAALVRVLPRSLVYGFGVFPVIWYYLTRPEGRLSAAIYQRRLGLELGPIRRFLFGLKQALAFSHVILDNMYLGIFGPDRLRLNEIGTDIFLKALERGKGLILLSAHAGNWHLAINFLSNTHTKVNLVTDDVRQEEVRRQMDMAKKRSGHLVVHDATQGPDLIFELRAALGRGEIVILAGDRVTTGRKFVLDFLGKQASFPGNAYHLSRATGAPICTALPFRTGMQSYNCYGLGPFRGDSPRKMAQEFVDHLEQLLRRYPEQWFNFYDFWEMKEK